MVMYGSEVFGGCESHVQSLSSMFNNAIRGMTMSWGRSAATLLRREFGLYSVHATAVASRARAMYKYLNNSRTMINTLLTRPFDVACWSTNTMTMLKRHGIFISEEMQTKPSAVFHYVREKVEAKEMNKKVNVDTKTAMYYNDNEFGKTRDFVGKFASKRFASPTLDMGVAGLIAARTGGMWLGHRAAAAKLIDGKYRTTCPCCEGAHRETMEHLVLNCPRWIIHRNLYLGPLINTLNGFNGEQKLSIVLGGTVRYDTASSFSLSDSYARGPNPVYLGVARFFGAIKKTRDSLLWRTSTKGLAASETPG